MNYVKDVPVAVFESIIRSLGHGRLEIHRAFPKTESLKDCMERTIPYFSETIYPDSIAKGQNVLIASSENAIRGLLMHLCEIPTDRIHELEIPTGLPLVFDVHRKCIKLLDDGSGENPFEKYNFGTSPDLLFRPCDLREENLITTGDDVDESVEEGTNSERRSDAVRVVSRKVYFLYVHVFTSVTWELTAAFWHTTP